MSWFRKKQHQHFEDGCLAFAVELEDGTTVCGMDYTVDEGEVI